MICEFDTMFNFEPYVYVCHVSCDKADIFLRPPLQWSHQIWTKQFMSQFVTNDSYVVKQLLRTRHEKKKNIKGDSSSLRKH